MFAIVSIAGQQFKVEGGQKIFVHRLDAKEGDKLTFDQVLLTSDGNNVAVGTPTVSGVAVTATVLSEMVKGDKVIVFKKKEERDTVSRMATDSNSLISRLTQSGNLFY